MRTKRRRATLADIRIRPLIDTAFCGVEEIEALAFAGSPFYAAWGIHEIYEAAYAADHRYECLIARSELGHHEEILGWAFFRRDIYSTTVLRIATHPSSWRKGIGRLMMETIHAGLTSSLLGVWIDDGDQETPRFLGRLGYLPGGSRLSDGATRRFFCRFKRPIR